MHTDRTSMMLSGFSVLTESASIYLKKKKRIEGSFDNGWLRDTIIDGNTKLCGP